MRTIGGDEVSAYSFGTMQFGRTTDADEAARVYDACRAAGINFFDTAHGYNDGRAEKMLGRLAGRERDRVFIATKTGGGGRSAPEIIDRQVPESLSRLGVGTVDVLYLHQIDAETPLEVSIPRMAAHVRAGRVRYLGISNHPAWATMKARAIAEAEGATLLFLQPMYNLVKRQAEVEILPMAKAEGLEVCPYSPLGGGLLTGKYAAGDSGRLREDGMYAARYAPGWMFEAAAQLAAVAEEAGVHPATLAVAWAARHPGVRGPIISGRTVKQLRPSLAAIGFEMDDALYDRLSALTPKPPPANDRLEVQAKSGE